MSAAEEYRITAESNKTAGIRQYAIVIYCELIVHNQSATGLKNDFARNILTALKNIRNVFVIVDYNLMQILFIFLSWLSLNIWSCFQAISCYLFVLQFYVGISCESAEIQPESNEGVPYYTEAKTKVYFSFVYYLFRFCF